MDFLGAYLPHILIAVIVPLIIIGVYFILVWTIPDFKGMENIKKVYKKSGMAITLIVWLVIIIIVVVTAFTNGANNTKRSEIDRTNLNQQEQRWEDSNSGMQK